MGKPIHCSLGPGFGGGICAASFKPVKSYKYSFLTHTVRPMTMLSFNHQHHINGLMRLFDLQMLIPVM